MSNSNELHYEYVSKLHDIINYHTQRESISYGVCLTSHSMTKDTFLAILPHLMEYYGNMTIIIRKNTKFGIEIEIKTKL